MSAVVTPPPLTGSAPAPPAPAPAAAGYPRPLLWTAEEFQRVGDSGVWEGRRPVLIGGVIWEQGMPNPTHSTSLSYAYEAVRAACPLGHFVRNQDSFDAGTRHDPLPDLAVVPGRIGDYAKAHPTEAVLVVEVSDTTLFFDRTTKAEVYAAAGIPVYWVIDVDGRVVHEFRDPAPLPPGGTAYRTHTEHKDGGTLAGPSGAAVAVADLLPPAG